MRRRFLQFIATFTFRRAGLVLPLIILLTWLSVRAALNLHFETSLISFLPPATAEMRLLGELTGDYRKLEPVMVVLRTANPGDREKLTLAANELARWLDDQTYFSRPLYKSVDSAQYQHLSLLRLAQFLPAEDWENLPDRIEQLLRDSAPGLAQQKERASRSDDLLTSGLLQLLRQKLAVSSGPAPMTGSEGYFFSPDGRALLMLVYPVLSPEDGNDALNTLRFSRRCVRFVMDRHEELRGTVSIEFYGGIISTGQHLEKIADDMAIILRFAIGLSFLLYLLVFRKIESLFFIALPPAIGLVWTLAITKLLYGGISVVTLMFLLIVVAMGLDYAIHLYHRFTLELYRTHHYYRALSRSYIETGRGLLACALLMVLLFLILFVTSIRGLEPAGGWWMIATHTRGFARLGLVAGIGILCNLMACLLATPLLAAIKNVLARGGIKPVRLYNFHLERIYMAAIINPRATLSVLLLTAVVLGFAARQLDFSANFAAISPFFYRPAAEPAADVKLPEGMGPEFPRPGRPVIAVVSGRTLEEALQRNDQLEMNLREQMPVLNIFSYDSLRWSLPSLATQRAALARLKQLDLKKTRARLNRVIAELKLSPVVLDPLLNTLATLQKAVPQQEPITLGSNSNEDFILNVQRHATRHDEWNSVATVIYPHANGFDQREIAALQRRLAGGLDHFVLIGDPVIERELNNRMKINFAMIILSTFFSLMLAVWLHFRSGRRALLAIIPVLFSVFCLCGMLALGGIQIHYLTVIALPLILCLALNHALQFTQYFYDRQPCSVRFLMQTLGRVVILTCGTIGLFLGTATLTAFPGLRDFGSTLLSGLLAVAVSILMLLPALLHVFGGARPAWPLLFGDLAEPEPKL